jgi:hypothetical protein
VTLNLGDVSTECLVFKRSKDSTVLVPQQISSNLQSSLDNIPAVGKIVTDAGLTSDYSVSSLQPLTALDGTLGPVDYDSNQRQWYRVYLNYKIELSANGRSWRNMCGENISEGGLLASAHKIPDLTIGQAVLLRIYLPGSEPVLASGVVRRVDMMQPNTPQATAKVRIRFTDVSARDARRLTQFIYKCQVNQSDRFQV